MGALIPNHPEFCDPEILQPFFEYMLTIPLIKKQLADLHVDDITSLTSAPGVGNRTASRIVLDLKGKLDDAEFDEISGVMGDVDGQVVAALTALGYSLSEAKSAAGAPVVAAEAEVDDRIRVALQQFATHG